MAEKSVLKLYIDTVKRVDKLSINIGTMRGKLESGSKKLRKDLDKAESELGDAYLETLMDLQEIRFSNTDEAMCILGLRNNMGWTGRVKIESEVTKSVKRDLIEFAKNQSSSLIDRYAVNRSY